MKKSRTVLLTDDEPSFAKYMESCLSRLSCDVFIEYTGKTSLHRAAGLRPDIAFLGVVMPEMGGVEAGIKLREVSPKTKIVLMNEHVPPEVMSELKAKGFPFKTLPAPFSLEQLRLVVED